MSERAPELERDGLPPVVAPGHSFESVTASIADVVNVKKTPRQWYVGAAIAFLVMQALLYVMTRLLLDGIGLWGVNQPVGWGWDIVNLVWWIGIGHAGTLISAILLLFRQKWRTSINRFAESMTLFAVACAGLFPIFHLGRPWLAYWLTPYPNTMGLWPNFRSPLVWDVFAISTYLTVSLLFWSVGLIPDLATMRDRATKRWQKIVFGLLSMGWRGSAAHWHRYETAYLILAGLSTPLVVSVHTVVSFDFATGIVPGWHATIFPPYFVAGAIFSGFAMVLTLAIPVRKLYKMEDFITLRHLDNMAKVTLATGLIVVYGYLTEIFMAYYSGNELEEFMIVNRFRGPYWYVYWSLFLCNALVPQALWSRRVRTSPWMLFVIAIVVNIGMWLERYTIIVISLHRDFVPSSWGMYHGTHYDVGFFVGTIGFFVACMFLFIRFLPMIAMFEMKLLLPGGHAKHPGHGEEGHG